MEIYFQVNDVQSQYSGESFIKKKATINKDFGKMNSNAKSFKVQIAF